MEDIRIRAAMSSDAAILRRVFESASHGLSPYLWRRAVKPGGDFEAFVAERMRAKLLDPDQTFKVAEIDGCPTGGILTYAIAALQSAVDPSPLERSFCEVDNALIGTLYVNALAVFPTFRRMGIASSLLTQARRDAARQKLPLSLSVSDANPDAVSTYLSNGFDVVGKVPMEKEAWTGDGENWLLMVNQRDVIWDRRALAPWARGATPQPFIAGA